MAEAALFSIASKVLTTIATPAFEKAYERARSINGASDELKELKKTITTIQAVLLDAEKQQDNSTTVKDWIGRVRDVLYDAEDLFDMVATDVLLKQQKKVLKTVRVFFSELNPIASSYFIAKKVKAVRKDLQRISDDMALFGFVKCESEKPISRIRRGAETGSFVGPEEVIGRDDEKEQVVTFVYNQAYADRNISLISIVGIGGMGKSTLAQLVYNDSKICGGFKHRYWACISDIFDEKEVLGKIYQSMTHQGQYQGLSLHQIQTNIRKSIDENGRFLLVLDDLWDEDTSRGDMLWSILSSDHAKGSKIIITTRHLSVAKAIRADKTLELKGLSKDASWALFRRYAFTDDKENDPAWISIGEKIVSKCVNVPLAIKSIASLLRVKDTIGEWKSLENEELSKIDLSDNPIMSGLRLSYDHLPSHLKNCFASCSLYPKGSNLKKQDLIYLWIAQGYIKLKKEETLEMAGHSYFMELLRRSLIEEAEIDRNDAGIRSYKMHDLVHDLAQDVAGEESCIITTQEMNQSGNKIRHVSVACEIDDESKNIPLLLLESSRLRSSLFICKQSCSTQFLDEQVTKFRFLRALSLEEQLMESIPSSIGEMRYLRYLNLSRNKFKHLPDSITKLVNLITLDISGCDNLLELPGEIRELVSLRHLINCGCLNLMHIPPTLGELTSLEHLSEFKVSKSSGDGKSCGLDALARLNLRESLKIKYNTSVDWCKDDVWLERGQIPDVLETLEIHHYPSIRMPVWWKDINVASRLPKLESLTIKFCLNVRNLAPLRCLPFLGNLYLEDLLELEYIEEEEMVASSTPFFPSLHTLTCMALRNLMGWSRPKYTTAAPLKFPFLSTLYIDSCPNLVSLPLAPCLKSLKLNFPRKELVQQLLSESCTEIEKFVVHNCGHLTNFQGEGLISLRILQIHGCSNLKDVRLASPNLVKEFTVYKCPNMNLWEERKEEEERSLNWDSFSNLCLLHVDGIPEKSRLPDCLQQLIVLGKLQIYNIYRRLM